MFHPENSGQVASLIGFGEFYIPGDDDRSKQLNEISELLIAQPIPTGMDPMTGQIQFQPTVMPDMDVDNHPIHIQTIKAFLVSETGQQVKRENPMGYQNCLAHLKAHEMGAMMQMMKEGLLGAGGDTEGSPEETETDVEAPKGVESGQS
jgi:hypothetical protein